MPGFNFDATQVTPAAPTSYGPLPKGHYTAVVMDSDVKTTQKGDGQYIAVTFQIIEGEFANRRVWQNINVSNPNKQAEDIGRSELAALCFACGVDKLSDTEQLHDIPLGIDVGIDKKDPERNRVMGYSKLEATTAKSAAVAPSATPKASAKPWEKR
ncbi:MAG: DUF669 domain-containing protein [Betaproteobacteria bacterium]|nr:DUF669 domain-containing protein [Betaproteobacteria bacterium]